MFSNEIPIRSRYLNLGCGDYYITSEEWANFDWAPKDKNVIGANLFLPFRNKGVPIELIYTSHFLEHLPLNQAKKFLQNCYNVLGTNGIIRIVVPDLENICNEYLNQIKEGNNKKIEFVTVELLDQLVRQKSGGELLSQYQKAGMDNDLRQYITKRNGHNFGPRLKKSTKSSTLKKLIDDPGVIARKLVKIYIKTLICLLPPNYRKQEIAYTSIGEKHKWIYDFFYLEKVLSEIGFKSITRVSADKSTFTTFPSIPLDIDELGNVRKGEESMYVEAVKL